jgi:hypothetical protein
MQFSRLYSFAVVALLVAVGFANLFVSGTSSQATTTTLTASSVTPTVNQQVTFTVTLKSGTTPVNGKSLSIYHYFNNVRYDDTSATTNAAGQISLNQSFGSTGQRLYYAIFPGDGTYATSSGALTVTVSNIKPGPGLTGWRSSNYGYQQQQPPSYWINVAKKMSSKVPNYSPAGIWILGVQNGSKCRLQFPGSDAGYIAFSKTDINEKYLAAFDEAGLKVWLQVEPANADVGTLIDLVLSRYSHHPCVVGFGVDVEWLQYQQYNEGRPVTNAEAGLWLQKIKSYNPEYKLFLKHWKVEKMPTAHLTDVVYISDNQQFANYQDMMKKFTAWGNAFSDAEVGFQYGYKPDRSIWQSFADPASQIGNDIIARVPNCRGLYWVDFTITDVFPP